MYIHMYIHTVHTNTHIRLTVGIGQSTFILRSFLAPLPGAFACQAIFRIGFVALLPGLFRLHQDMAAAGALVALLVKPDLQ